MDISQFSRAKVGTTIILQDFHTLEALGDKYTGVVKGVQNVSTGGVLDGMSIMRLFIRPGEGVELAVTAFVGFPELANPTFRLFRKWVDGPAIRIDDPVFLEGPESFPRKFIPFNQRFGDTPANEGPIPFAVCPGFPVRMPDQSFCAWEADPNRVDQNYWARHCLVDVIRSGFATVWFGWDLTSKDVDLVVA